MAALMRAHHAVVSGIDEGLRSHELSRTAWLLMATLVMSREHTRPLGDLSRQMLVHATTVTLVVDQLERKGLVRRRPHPTDRRTTLAVLTASGRRTLARANSSLAARGYGLGGLDTTTRGQLVVCLTACTDQAAQNLD